MSNLRKIADLELYTGAMGNIVNTPVMQVGKGGPHVVMVAVQHGWEVIGLDTALQVMQNSSVTGTLTLITVANPDGFNKSSRLAFHDMTPSTGQPTNLNRVHPGKKEGTAAERSAYAIDQYIQSLSPDYVLDLHSYATQSVPHCIVDPCDAKLATQIHGWMQNAQVNWYKEYDDETLVDQSLDQALAAIWVKRGLPSITIELGPLRSFSPSSAKKAQNTLVNVLSSINAVSDQITNAQDPELEGSTWQRKEVVYSGSKGGYLRSLTATPEKIKNGQPIAEVVSPDGTTEIIRSTNDGVMFIWSDEYRVFAGSVVGVMLVAG